MNHVLSEHTLVFGQTPVPHPQSQAGVEVSEGVSPLKRGVFYFEVVVASSWSSCDLDREDGVFRGSDVYVGVFC